MYGSAGFSANLLCTHIVSLTGLVEFETIIDSESTEYRRVFIQSHIKITRTNLLYEMIYYSSYYVFNNIIF